jgi:hypothetical protein
MIPVRRNTSQIRPVRPLVKKELRSSALSDGIFSNTHAGMAKE